MARTGASAALRAGIDGWLAGQPPLDLIVTMDDAAIYSAFRVPGAFRGDRGAGSRPGQPLLAHARRGRQGGQGQPDPGRAPASDRHRLIAAYSPEASGPSACSAPCRSACRRNSGSPASRDRRGQPLALKVQVYLPQHNARFATPAEDQGTAFVPFAGALDDILCIHEDRTVANDNTVRYKRLALQIPADRHRRHYVKATVRVHEYPDGTLAVFHGPRCLARYKAGGEPIDTSTRQAA